MNERWWRVQRDSRGELATWLETTERVPPLASDQRLWWTAAACCESRGSQCGGSTPGACRRSSQAPELAVASELVLGLSGGGGDGDTTSRSGAAAAMDEGRRRTRFGGARGTIVKTAGVTVAGKATVSFSSLSWSELSECASSTPRSITAFSRHDGSEAVMELARSRVLASVPNWLTR